MIQVKINTQGYIVTQVQNELFLISFFTTEKYGNDIFDVVITDIDNKQVFHSDFVKRKDLNLALNNTVNFLNNVKKTA